MRKYLELGASPYDTDCVQVGVENYGVLALAECNRYRRQLEEQFKDRLTTTITFGVKKFGHGDNRYFEAVVYFDADDPAQVEYAYYVEANLPAKWMPQVISHGCIRIHI